jgi:sarcosine oxidase subunit alpha
VVARRLPLAAEAAASQQPRRVRFTFDGRTYDGVEGEPLAVSLMAADRLILSRSFRFHRPRGLLCDTGQCGWCECQVDGRPSVRSCQVPVRDGLVARSEHAWPSVERDLFGWLDLGSRFVPPTFYHHRFLRPARLRKLYLDVIRGFGGRGRLPIGRAAPVPRRLARELEVDVLVVGGGRSGVAAAEDAAGRGSRVALIEGVRGRARPTDPGIQLLDGASAVGWYEGMVTAIDDATLWTIRAGEVVAATGTYERVPTVLGADRPGVIGARRVLETIRRSRVLPGARALLVGDSEALVEVGAALRDAGATVVGPIETVALRKVLGRRRVIAAVIEAQGSSRRETVDLVVLGDRSPNVDLVRAAGAAVEARDGLVVPVVDDAGRTTVPGLRVVGSAAGRAHADGVVVATRRPEGRALVCFCEDVHADELRAQVTSGYGDPELVKRRTGALTGPCQGKYCLAAFVATLADAGRPTAVLPTARPPLRPIRLGDLVASEDQAER